MAIKYSDVTFGQMEAVLNKIHKTGGENAISRLLADELLVVERQSLAKPSPVVTLQRNHHGHVIITVTGLSLTGAEEIARLEAAGYRVSNYAKSVLLSKGDDGYDAQHRLVAGQSYAIALVPGTVIKDDRDRTTANLRLRGLEFGYAKPHAGIMPRVREAVSDEQLKEMSVWYIAGLHDTIADFDGDPRVLAAYRLGGGRWLDAFWDHPGSRWNARGAFAFLVPAR